MKALFATSLNKLKYAINSRLLRNKDISVISNNCWGGFMCQYSRIRYNSPFVGLFFFAPDYIKVLQHIEVIYEPFSFRNKKDSKYKELLDIKEYPIGYWEKYDIEIHFLHYKSEEECLEKWNKRLCRLNFDNLIVKFCDRDLCTYSLIKTFDSLPYLNKVCFTSKPYPQFKSVVWLKEQSSLEQVQNCWLISDKYYNFVKHCNEASAFKTSLMSRLLLNLAAHIDCS